MDTSITELKPSSAKEQQWQKAIDKIHQLERGDPHGLNIDQKIKGTVIGLNAFGINTIMSCEGHADHGSGYPYIKISANEAFQYDREANEAYVLQRHADYERLREASKKVNGELLIKLQGYLNEFYSSREASPDIKLVAELMSHGPIYLRNQGFDTQEDATSNEKSANLGRFQEEMEMFGKFLETKFFS